MTPDPAAVRWSQLRLGAAALVAIVAVSAIVFSLDVVLRELSEGPRVVVVASEARDLRPGADVWIAGVPAGRVTRVGFQTPDESHAGRVVVRAVLHEDARSLLRRDAGAVIRSSALLAPAVLDLRPGDAPEPLAPGDTIAAEAPLTSEDVLARMEDLRQRLERLGPEARRLGARLARGPGTLASLRRDPSLVRELRGAAADFRSLGRAEGTLERVAGDTALAARVRRIRSRLRSAGGEDGSSPEADWSVLAGDLARLRVRIDTLAARVDAGRGSAGRFLTDRELVESLRRVRARVDSVRTDLFAHPFRWLRFRIF